MEIYFIDNAHIQFCLYYKAKCSHI